MRKCLHTLACMLKNISTSFTYRHMHTNAFITSAPDGETSIGHVLFYLLDRNSA